MLLNSQKNHQKTALSSVNPTETTTAKYLGRSDESLPVSQVLFPATHQLTDLKIHDREQQCMKIKHDFDHTQLKNPDPSNAFFFVMMIAFGAILLPFIPIAVNYCSQLIEDNTLNNTPTVDYLVKSDR